MHCDLETILSHDFKLPPELLADPDNTLEDAGVDSLAVVELSVLLGERFGIEVSESDIKSAATLGQLDQLIQRTLAAHGQGRG